MKYEYKIFTYSSFDKSAGVNQLLNIYGKDGWELISVTHDHYNTYNTYYLKRIINESK